MKWALSVGQLGIFYSLCVSALATEIELWVAVVRRRPCNMAASG